MAKEIETAELTGFILYSEVIVFSSPLRKGFGPRCRSSTELTGWTGNRSEVKDSGWAERRNHPNG